MSHVSQVPCDTQLALEKELVPITGPASRTEPTPRRVRFTEASMERGDSDVLHVLRADYVGEIAQ